VKRGRDYINHAEEDMEDRENLIKNAESSQNQQAGLQEEELHKVDKEAEEELRRKRSREREIMRKNEQQLNIKKERITQTLKKDNNIMLRGKKTQRVY